MGYDGEQTRSYFSRYGTSGEKSDYYQELLTGNIIALSGTDEGSMVLDVGCGFGRYTDRYEKVCTVVGLDLSIPMLKIAKTKGISNLIVGDATRLPFGNSCYDVVLTHGVSTILQPETADVTVEEMLRVSKGKVLIVTPSAQSKIRAFLRGKQGIYRPRLKGERRFGSSAVNYFLAKFIGCRLARWLDIRLGSIPIVKDFLSRSTIAIIE